MTFFEKKLPKIVFFFLNIPFFAIKKKSQVFGNFLTFKWQFSRGSGLTPNSTIYNCLEKYFNTFWRGAPKYTETDLKKSHICRIWGQSDPLWTQPDTRVEGTEAAGKYRPQRRHARQTRCWLDFVIKLNKLNTTYENWLVYT